MYSDLKKVTTKQDRKKVGLLKLRLLARVKQDAKLLNRIPVQQRLMKNLKEQAQHL